MAPRKKAQIQEPTPPPPPPAQPPTPPPKRQRKPRKTSISTIEPPPPPSSPLTPPSSPIPPLEPPEPPPEIPIIDILKADPEFKKAILNIIQSSPEFKTILIQLIQTSPAIQSVIKTLIPANQPQQPQHPNRTCSRQRGNQRYESPPPQPPPTQSPTTTSIHDIELTYEQRILIYLKQNTKATMTYEEFSDTVEIEEADLEHILQTGFVQGFSDLIIKHLVTIELHRRPVYSFSLDIDIIYIKVSPTNWKRDTPKKLEHMSEIVFDFAQKVDLKIAEFREAGPPEGTTPEEWNDRLDRILKQASGGMDRIRLIGEVSKKVAAAAFVPSELVHSIG